MLKNYECDWLNVAQKNSNTFFFCCCCGAFFRLFFGMFHANRFSFGFKRFFNFHVSMIAAFSRQLNASFRNSGRIQCTIKCKLLLIESVYGANKPLCTFLCGVSVCVWTNIVESINVSSELTRRIKQKPYAEVTNSIQTFEQWFFVSCVIWRFVFALFQLTANSFLCKLTFSTNFKQLLPTFCVDDLKLHIW